jgi:GNAT superfamily N-acetyltransferase
LEADRLVTIEPDPADRRRRRCRLTPAGRRLWTKLDRRSDEIAGDVLAPLTAGQRQRLVAALAAAERLLAAASVTFDDVDPTGPAATAAMEAYFAELDARFPGGFDPAGALGRHAKPMGPPHGAFVVARAPDGAVVSCGGVQRIDHDTAEIKRMWVDPSWRGHGLGRRMLAELELRASRLGHARVVLDTNAVLTEALAMYGAAGYQPTDRYNDNPYAQHWFAKSL